MLKNRILKLIDKFYTLFQNIYLVFHPIKIYEYKELIRDVNFSKKDTILDIGCGNGIETLMFGKKCNQIYGIDIDKENILKAKQRSLILKKRINSNFLLTRLERANFKEEFFDKIISLCVLEHIPNYLEVLNESYRILKKDGQFLISVDSLELIEDEKILRFHTDKYYVAQYFNINNLKTILQKIGFKRIRIYSICRTSYSKKIFIKYITNERRIIKIFSIFEYLRLKYKDTQYSHNSKGIILIIKAIK